MPLRIAIAARDVVGTGAGSVALATAVGLFKQGHEVCLVTDYKVDTIPSEIKNCTTPLGKALHSWKPSTKVALRMRHLAQIVFFNVFARKILRELEQSGFISIDHNAEAGGADLIVMHNVFHAQFKADNRPLLRRIPQFVNPIFILRLLRERVVLRSARRAVIIGVSRQATKEAKSIMRQGKQAKIAVTIPNGIDVETYAPIDASRARAIKEQYGATGKFVCAFVGHEFERKGLKVTLDAVRLLPENVSLWIFGGRGSDISSYQKYAHEIGIVDRVAFFGTRDDVATLLPAADCFILPSFYETWGMVTLEAMACGVPPIMSNVGCAPVVIKHGVSGYIAAIEANSIAEYIRVLLHNPEILRQMRYHCRVEAEKFAWSVIIDDYTRVISSVSNQVKAP